MDKATHIIRFVANEDGRIHLGQPVDTSRDVGLDSFEGKETKAYLLNGSIFDAEVTGHVRTVKQLLSPVSQEDCNYIRCLGLNYVDHAKVSHTSCSEVYQRRLSREDEIEKRLTILQEGNHAVPKAPIVFTKPRNSLNDPYPAAIPVCKAAQDETIDYEVELCVVIGKTGKNIPEDKALDYVLGYTCSNDVSARTFQRITSQWCHSKGMDGSCPLGR